MPKTIFYPCKENGMKPTHSVRLEENSKPIMKTPTRIIEFLNTYCFEVEKDESGDYVDLMMDDHITVSFNHVKYYIPKNNMLMTDEDLEIKDLLISNSAYVGQAVHVVECVYSNIIGSITTVLEQMINDMDDVILCLNIPHPEDENTKLWVNENEIELFVKPKEVIIPNPIKVSTFFIIDCSGFTEIDSPDKMKHYFETFDEAIEVAKLHKETPQLWNSKITKDNISYWQRQVYTVVKKTIITEELAVI